MKISPLSVRSSSDPWQRIQMIVNHYQGHRPPHLIHQFNQLVYTRTLANNALAFLLQYIGLSISVLTVNPTPAWLAPGTALALLLMRGYRILPGIWTGSFLAYILAKANVEQACHCATLHTLQALLLTYISLHYIYPTLVFYQRRLLVKFFLYTGLLTAINSTLLAWSTFPRLTKFELLIVALPWWLANLIGVLIYACTFLTWDVYFPQLSVLKKINPWKLGVCYSLLVLIAGILICCHTPLATLALALALLPLIGCIGRWFGWCGIISALFFIVSILSFAACYAAPLFTTSFTATSLLLLQLLLLVETIIGLYITVPVIPS